MNDLESRVKGLEETVGVTSPSTHPRPQEPKPTSAVVEGSPSIQRFRGLIQQIVREVLEQIVHDLWNEIYRGSMDILDLVGQRVDVVELFMETLLGKMVEDSVNEEDDSLLYLAPSSPQ